MRVTRILGFEGIASPLQCGLGKFEMDPSRCVVGFEESLGRPGGVEAQARYGSDESATVPVGKVVRALNEDHVDERVLYQAAASGLFVRCDPLKRFVGLRREAEIVKRSLRLSWHRGLSAAQGAT